MSRHASKAQLDSGHDIIVIGASAGGFSALRILLPLLPPEFPAAVFVVLHHPPADYGKQFLEVLGWRPQLPVTVAHHGEVFERGHVYLAPSGRHLLLDVNLMLLENSPKESHCKPSIDALFRSAAFNFSRRVIGVILTGMLSDGTAGLWQVKKHGGVTIVQDPGCAEHPAMPQSALCNVDVDYCLGLTDIAHKLVELATESPAVLPHCG